MESRPSSPNILCLHFYEIVANKKNDEMRNYNFKSDFSFLKKKWSYAVLVSNSHGCYTESPSHVLHSSGPLGRAGAVSCCAALWDGLNPPVFSADL